MRAATAPAAHASVRHALAEARAQEAPWLELLALVELCEHGAKAADRHALAALVEQLPEAGDTAARPERERCSARQRPPECRARRRATPRCRPAAKGLTGVEGIAGNDLGP